MPKNYFIFNDITRQWDINVDNLVNFPEFDKKKKDEILNFVENLNFSIKYKNQYVDESFRAD